MADTRPLLSYLRVQEAWEKDALFAMKQAAARSSREIARLASIPGIGASIRGDQLRMARAALLEEQARLWEVMGGSVQSARAAAAAAAIESGFVYDDMLMQSSFTPLQRDAYLRAAQATARRNVENVTVRIKGYSKFPLSEQVYKSRAWSNNLIDSRINAALGSGASARELAKSVQDLIRPDTPGGVKYAAMRLGRTEINNAHHATSVLKAQKTPWVTGVRWNLSGSHPKPDECNEYADSVHYDGGEAGVFLPDEVPAKPHPNCLCFTTPTTVSEGEFIKNLNDGAYDEHLDQVMRDAGYPDIPRVPTRCP